MTNELGERECKDCALFYPIEEFVKDNRASSGYKNQCKYCNNKRKRELRKLDPRKHKGHQLKRKYGISIQEYEELLLKQGYRCKICLNKQSSKALCVDHDHVTGEVRGLLCDRYNRGLGDFNDNVDSLKNAIEYLLLYKS